MLKLENIRLINGVVYCKVKGVDYEMDLEVSISNWNDVKFSDIHHKLDALHARNRLYNEFLDSNGRLPNELQIHFG